MKTQKKDKIILRSLGYLSFPNVFKKKFGINSKRKERLKIFPEPTVEMTTEDGCTYLIYKWDNADLDEYIEKVNKHE